MGLTKNENMNQGSFIVKADALGEEACWRSSTASPSAAGAGCHGDRLPEKQNPEESLYYEALKHSGELPIIA